MKLIYVASPLAGNIEANTNRAREYCKWTAMQGEAPVALHLMYPQFLDEHNPSQRELGCEMGLRVLQSCDELWAFGEVISPGMSSEITEAKKLGVPVRYVMNHELGVGSAKYGVWAVRTATPLFGRAEDWCKDNGVPLSFDTEGLAQEYADSISTSKLRQTQTIMLERWNRGLSKLMLTV